MRPGLCLMLSIILMTKFDRHATGDNPMMRMCLYRSDARHRNTIAKFEVTDIDFNLCSHYIYGYGQVDNSSHVLQPEAPSIEEGSNGLYKRFNAAKKHAPGLKTLLAIGGSQPLAHYGLTAIGTDETLAQSFAVSAVGLAVSKEFDGLVLDWQAPSGVNTWNPTVVILEKLRAEFNKVSRSKYLLLVVLQEVMTQLDMATITNMMKSVDYVIVRAYDYPMNGGKFALFSSPLYPGRDEAPYNTYCVNYSLTYWKNAGISYAKIVVGMTAVGRTLELANSSQYLPGSLITPEVHIGSYYNIKSGLAYPEVCVVKKSSQVYFDDVQKNPYLVRGSNWVGFEDTQSLELKIKLFQQRNVAGFMFSALDEDDFTGTVCNEGRYPLLSHIKDIVIPPPPGAITTTSRNNVDDESFDLTALTDSTTARIVLVVGGIVLFVFGYTIGHMIIDYCKKKPSTAPVEEVMAVEEENKEQEVIPTEDHEVSVPEVVENPSEEVVTEEPMTENV